MSKNKVSKFEEQYGPLADQMAQKYNLDPVLFRNQIRQESGFNPAARSGVGAVGIGQFMPGTAKAYGYSPEQLIQNPQIALDIAAKHMRKLSDTYGDQRLALAAYNGGGGSIDFVKQKLGKKKVTYEEWVKFNEDRRAQLGDSPTAWHGQTLDYVKKITGKAGTTVASNKPPKEAPRSIAPPTPQSAPIVADNSPSFDYHEALIKRQQGNPQVDEVPQAASQTHLLADGQPDPTQNRMHQIAEAYAKLEKERLVQQQQLQAQQQQMEAQKQPTPEQTLKGMFDSVASSLPQASYNPIQLQDIQLDDNQVQMNRNQNYGGFSA